MMASTACNARPSHSSFQRCNLYPRTSVNSSVRRTTCGVAGPLSPQEHTPRVPVLNFQPRVGRTDHGLEMQQPINVPQHHAMTPEPLYERLRKECHSACKLSAVHKTGGVLNELSIGDLEWVPTGPSPQPTAAGELLLTANAQPTEELGHDATPWKQYDVLQLATTIAAVIASATARNDEFARPFAHAPAAMQAEEVPNVLESIGVSRRVSRCLDLALGARPGEESPTASHIGSIFAYEAIKVLAQGEYRASAQELQTLTALCGRLGLKGMDALVEGSGEVVRRRAREVQEAHLKQAA